MRTTLAFVTATIATLVSTMTMAAAVLPNPCGWYLEGNYGTSRATGINIAGVGASGNGAGWSIHGGYKFMPNFAAELGYTDYASTDAQDDAGITFAKIKHYSIEGAAKGIYPIGVTGFDIFAKLGVAYIHSNVDEGGFIGDDDNNSDNGTSSTGAYLGGGIEYALAHEILVNAQWERAFGNSHTGKLDLLSVGVAWIVM